MIDVKYSNVFQRSLSGFMPLITGAFGDEMISDIGDPGSRWIDLSGGAAVTSIHFDNEEIEPIKTPGDPDYVYSGFGTTHAAEYLADLIKSQLDATHPGWFGKALFLCSGGEAVEAACKIAAQFWIERGQLRNKFAARRCSYHGTSFFTLALGDHNGVYSHFNDLLEDFRDRNILRISGYMNPEENEMLSVYAPAYYEQAIHNYDRLSIEAEQHNIAAVVIETVGGPTFGIATPSNGYLQGIRDICTGHDAPLLIFDEVMCGVGRAGAFTAAQRFGVMPDILVLGKAITSGLAPLSVVVVSQRVIDAIEAGSGLLWHGTTHMNHPASCYTGSRVLSYMLRKDLFNHVLKTEALFKQAIRDAMQEVPMYWQVTGLGRMFCIWLDDPVTGEPFAPEIKMAARVRKLAIEHGLVLYTKGQTIGGEHDLILISPSYEMPLDVFEDALQILAGVCEMAYKAWLLESAQ